MKHSLRLPRNNSHPPTKLQHRTTRGLLVTALSAVALSAPSAHAVLLTSAYETQIEGWLGLGDVTFTTIYNQAGAGMSNAGFHNAADGMGATITLLSVGAYDNYWNIPNQIIGGYNPRDWYGPTFGNFNISNTDAERTAFLFNLTYDLVQRQNLIGDNLNSGLYQTYNDSNYGPAFGSGSDISANLTYPGASGFAGNFSYGGTSYAQPITRGATDGSYESDRFSIAEIEVLTFSRVPNNIPGTNVPDAGSTLGLLGLGLFGLAGARRLKSPRA